MTSMTETPPDVSLTIHAGVDTHKHTHHAAIVDHLGRRITDREFPATDAGHHQLLTWLAGTGVVASAGVEGTGSYGAGLTHVLRGAGLTVVDVDHPDRRSRRRHGKSDPIDAYAAATAALTGRATTVPKTHDGDVEAIRFLHNARRSVVKSRAEAITALKAMIVNAPETVRAALRELPDPKLFRTCAAWRPGPIGPGDLTAASRPRCDRWPAESSPSPPRAGPCAPTSQPSSLIPHRSCSNGAASASRPPPSC
jgi:transposase